MRLRFGNLVFDAQRRELRRGEESLPLTPKAFRLLEMLIEARPNPVPTATLYDGLWPDVAVEAGNLHTLISELRTTLGDRTLIRTVHRVGYTFTGSTSSEESGRYSLLLGDEEIPLLTGANGIGRDPRDRVVLNVPEVSRHHARITILGTRITVEDLGSKNGTFVRGVRITAPTDIAAGDEILIGTIRMRLVELDSLAPTATAG
jgi:DNA-binding winged helix-turn-helix (wHTH) protein